MNIRYIGLLLLACWLMAHDAHASYLVRQIEGEAWVERGNTSVAIHLADTLQPADLITTQGRILVLDTESAHLYWCSADRQTKLYYLISRSKEQAQQNSQMLLSALFDKMRTSPSSPSGSSYGAVDRGTEVAESLEDSILCTLSYHLLHWEDIPMQTDSITWEILRDGHAAYYSMENRSEECLYLNVVRITNHSQPTLAFPGTIYHRTIPIYAQAPHTIRTWTEFSFEQQESQQHMLFFLAYPFDISRIKLALLNQYPPVNMLPQLQVIRL